MLTLKILSAICRNNIILIPISPVFSIVHFRLYVWFKVPPVSYWMFSVGPSSYCTLELINKNKNISKKTLFIFDLKSYVSNFWQICICKAVIPCLKRFINFMYIFCFILVFRSMVWRGAVSWVQTNRFSVSSNSLQFKH